MNCSPVGRYMHCSRMEFQAYLGDSTIKQLSEIQLYLISYMQARYNNRALVP